MASFSNFEKALGMLFTGGGLCTGMAILYSNTYGLERYKNMLAIQSPDGKEEKVDVEILKMAEEIKQAKPQRQFEEPESISVFPSSSMEFCRVGTTKIKQGSHLGVPKYYLHKFRTDEEHWNALFQSMDIDPNSDAAQNIRQSFNISTDAKRFAIAREINLCGNYQFLYFVCGSLAVGASYLGPYYMTSVVPSAAVRVFTFIPLSLFWYNLCPTLLDISSRFVVKGADKAAASISPQVAQAGLEYYDAAIVRHKTLNMFRVEKNVNKNTFSLQNIVCSSWLESCMTLQERKRNLEELIKTL